MILSHKPFIVPFICSSTFFKVSLRFCPAWQLSLLSVPGFSGKATMLPPGHTSRDTTIAKEASTVHSEATTKLLPIVASEASWSREAEPAWQLLKMV